MPSIIFLMNVIKSLLCYIIKRKKTKIKEKKIICLGRTSECKKFIYH